MDAALSDISYHHAEEAAAESEQSVGAMFYQWVGCRDHAEISCFPQESFAFLILGVGRLRDDQLIYVEARENVFFNMGPLIPPGGTRSVNVTLLRLQI